MNRRIAAFTIAAVAVLGLTACAGGNASEETPEDASNSNEAAPAEETNTDQSVEDACGIVIPELTEAGTALSSIDPEAAAKDPQASVDQFNTFVDALGETVDKVSNTEVKDATAAVHEEFVKLSDMLNKVLVEQDLDAASDLNTVQSDVMEASTTLQELCS